jgi:hypothetical protein
MAELVRQLEAGTLPAAEFSHRNHVRAGWFYLNQLPLRDAAHKFRDTLLRYVRGLGAEDKFHLTLTLAFMHVIRARMNEPSESWESFAARNPDLFDNARSLIARHYSAARMADGRHQFAEPDLAPLP